MAKTSLPHPPMPGRTCRWLALVFAGISLAVYLILVSRVGSDVQGLSMAFLDSVGAKVDSKVSEGEWFRLLTASWLHVDIHHWGINGLNLFLVAFFMDRIGGTGRAFSTAFIAGGILGFSLSFLVGSGFSVGASGGLYGALGLLVISLWRGGWMVDGRVRVVMLLVGLLVVANFFIQEGHDHAAHLGGLLTGAGIGFWVNRKPKSGLRPGT
jgi:rhomboid protease GluP